MSFNEVIRSKEAFSLYAMTAVWFIFSVLYIFMEHNVYNFAERLIFPAFAFAYSHGAWLVFIFPIIGIVNRKWMPNRGFQRSFAFLAMVYAYVVMSLILLVLNGFSESSSILFPNPLNGMATMFGVFWGLFYTLAYRYMIK